MDHFTVDQRQLYVQQQIPTVSTWYRTDSTPQRCRICGDTTKNKHFGTVSCSACSAFFRRTVAFGKSYQCTREKACDIRADEPRHQCRFCRFQRCIQMGMVISAVSIQRPKESTSTSDGFLQQLLHCRRAIYVNRYRSTLKAYAGQHKLIRFGKQNPNFLHTTLAAHSEYAVLREYLRSSGFPEIGIDGIQLEVLVQSFFYNWVCFTSALNTCRNNGHETNHAYFVDESHVSINEDALELYHKTCWLNDPVLVARVSFDTLKTAVNAAIKFSKARLDEAEMTVICHLMALRKAQTLFPENTNIQLSINLLFENLREHYEENYEDFALRLGSLILMIQEIEYVHQNFNEYVVILNLNGYDSVLDKIREMQRRTESVSSTPSVEIHDTNTLPTTMMAI
ncbi:Nuclear receptor domain-containing protein [Aphelenchoides besseyi]|nr:Nuclear receptor domain-containing protein [Aphelenchoides besseyi]